MSALYDRVLQNERERELLLLALQRIQLWDEDDRGVHVTVKRYRNTRSTEQSATMWSMLGDLERQLKWPVDGVLRSLSAEEWKDVVTAGLRKNQHVAQGIEGGFVMLGQRTSSMTSSEMHELIEFLAWFGASREPQINWTAYPPDPLKSKRRQRELQNQPAVAHQPDTSTRALTHKE